MTTTALKIFVKADPGVADAVASRSDGGSKLAKGVKELVADQYPVAIDLVYEQSSGFANLRSELEQGTSRLIADAPEVVVLSIADDIRGLNSRGANAEEAVRAVEADLVAVVELIKEKVGAHILVANASTLDPGGEVMNYHGLDEDPVSLRAHRLDHMLVGVSHDEGISIIDVDRKIAELGGHRGVAAALTYTESGCEIIAAEIVRVLEDYGFFDERPLLAQVGAKASGA